MSDYIHDVNSALKLMEGALTDKDCNDSFNGCTLCYGFSNENIAEYYPKYITPDSKVLTVCGSGDQVLSAVLYGAKKVDCFDCNKLAYYNLMLKIYAVKFLDFNDFYFLYFLTNRIVDRKAIYNKFSSKIQDMNVRMFWNVIFNNYSDKFPYLFRERNNNMFDITLRIPFLNEENFYKLKSLIDNCDISFKLLDLFDVVNNYTDKYDFINFSNILDYVDSARFVSFIEYIKVNNLKDTGSIMANYSWKESNSVSLYNGVASSIGASQHDINLHYSDMNSAGSIMVCKGK